MVALAQCVALCGGDVMRIEAALEDVKRVEVAEGFVSAMLGEDPLADALVFEAQDFQTGVGGERV